MPVLSRPLLCHPCVLNPKAEGFAPADGPSSSWLLMVGEALGKIEAMTGRPFMGDAGGMLQRLLNLLGWKREDIRIHNVISCRPPGDWFDERAPYFHDAFHYCPYLPQTLNEGHSVVVTMGTTALRKVMKLQGHKKVRIQDFHGTTLRDPDDRFWVVPTYHPSFLQRGAHNLIGTVLWDLLRAVEARDHGKPHDHASIIVDPPLDWFRTWVDQVIAARQQDPFAYPISSDVETPDKAGGRDEGEITPDDRSYQILRVNVSCHTDEGITVPFAGPYIDELRRLHRSPGHIWQWNKVYDVPRLVNAEILVDDDHRRVVDLMWLAHYLQSDLPRGLGFWAPFYSTFGPWKHQADSQPAWYGAVDGLQNHRVGFGILTDLQKLGMHEGAMRHVHQLQWTALLPAQRVGVKIDRQRLQIFKQELIEKATTALNALQVHYPAELCPLTPKGGLKSPPLADVLHVKASAFTRKGKKRAGRAPTEIKLDLYKRAKVVEKIELREVMCCMVCGEKEVSGKHRCQVSFQKPDGSTGWRPSQASPDIQLQPASVTRWYWQEPFNPDSPPQVLGYIKFKGRTDKKHTPGRAKKTHKESTDRETLEKLEKRTKDPFYRSLLDYRAIVKVKGTYVEGTERRLDADDRVHPEYTFRPSMGRLSAINPNLTNVVADKGAAPGTSRSLAAGFRRCVVAAPGCRLLEVDFSSIEALKVGDRARDPEYIRLGRLGIHSGMCTYVLGRPFDKSWLKDRVADLRVMFDEIKYAKDEKTKTVYDTTKRFVHGKAYGLTIYGMTQQFPELFPTLEVARRYERIFNEFAPKVVAWQKQTQERAAKDHYLGGIGDHPYGYKHWFWSVFTFKKITETQYYRAIALAERLGVEPNVTLINELPFKIGYGEDAKRTLAFYPQSIAAGDLKEVEIALFDPDSPSFIGDAYYGKTPLRGPIHDSLLLEVPDRQWDRVCEKIFIEMQRPLGNQPLPAEWEMGPYMTNNIGAKAGHDWEKMERLAVPGFSDLEPSFWTPAEDEDWEEGLDLARTA
jgi:uracil-DNA glycosylase family 4